MRARDVVLTTALVVVTTLVLIGLARLLLLLTDILVLILISAILATGFSPLVTAIERQRLRVGRRDLRLSQPVAILVLYAALFLVIGTLGSIILTPLVAEATAFVQQLPEILGNLGRTLDRFEARYPWLPNLSGYLTGLPERLAGLSRHLGTAAGVVFRVFGGLAALVTVLFMTFYMLMEARAIKEQFLTLFPAEQRERVEAVLLAIGQKFGGWLRGQVILMTIIGVAAGVGTALLGIRFALLLGLIAGLTEVIPIIGPILGAVPAVLVALFQGPWVKVVLVIALYTVIQQVEGNLIVPRVMRAAVGLSPLLTIIALIVGARLLGVMGALLSVPVAAALQVIVGEILNAVRRDVRRADRDRAAGRGPGTG